LRDPVERDYGRDSRMSLANCLVSTLDSRLVRLRLALALTLVALAAAASGCTPKIGSACTQPTDCSSQGDRVCDTAQPGGYCTILNCLGSGGAACPDNAACVEFQVAVPGCPYDDYASPARTGQSFCMEHCGQNSDCRDGYQCADPRFPPWNAAILDNNQSQSVCIASPPPNTAPSASQDGGVEGGVCTKSLPSLPALPDASSLVPEASSSDGSTPADGAVGDAPFVD
jgi:hypothetical protein